MSSWWTFAIEEVSAGCYRSEAIRQTHHSFSRDGFEGSIAELVRDAFDLELQLGTSFEESAFRVTAGYQKFWRTEHHGRPGGFVAFRIVA